MEWSVRLCSSSCWQVGCPFSSYHSESWWTSVSGNHELGLIRFGCTKNVRVKAERKYKHTARPWIQPPDHCSQLQVRGHRAWPGGTPVRSPPARCLRTGSAQAKPGRWTRTASVGGEKRGEEQVDHKQDIHHHEKRGHTYISLDHLTALSSDPGDEAKHVHLPLSDHHVQHRINHNEGARPPHTSTDRETKLELKRSTQNNTY